MLETFAFEELSIRYRRTGSGAPMVMLHNGGTSHVIWNEVIERLVGFEVFALDLLGFGASSKPGKGYELSRHVAILKAFIEAHDLAPVRLVGNCMGSATSLAYAMAHPQNVRAMVLINTLTAATFETGIYSLLYGLPERAPGVVEVMSKIPLGSRFGALGVRSQLGRRGLARKVHRQKELASCYASASQSRALLEVLADIPNYNVLDAFEPPADFPPICTVWGLENRVLPPGPGRVWVEGVRPQREAWLEGCGHLPMLEDPERVAAIIMSFMSSEPTDAGHDHAL